MDEENTPQSEKEEPTFDIKITNGVAKSLQSSKEKLGKKTAKEVVALGLQVIEFALKEDDSELVVKRANGDEVRIVLNTPNDGE